MKNRLRWLLLVCALGFLLKTIFGQTTHWSVAGFFLCGVAWYYLTWRRTRELDSPKPR
ncbi:MAG: hypothetical protein HY077_15605 [Elusimicrobia bacterium]|nr:hypothetical protein [Elusimicrobiota bacterium]